MVRTHYTDGKVTIIFDQSDLEIDDDAIPYGDEDDLVALKAAADRCQYAETWTSDEPPSIPNVDPIIRKGVDVATQTDEYVGMIQYSIGLSLNTTEEMAEVRWAIYTAFVPVPETIRHAVNDYYLTALHEQMSMQR